VAVTERHDSFPHALVPPFPRQPTQAEQLPAFLLCVRGEGGTGWWMEELYIIGQGEINVYDDTGEKRTGRCRLQGREPLLKKVS